MNKTILVIAGLIATSAQAWDCKYRQEIDETLNVSESDTLTIAAAAGDLEITGVSGTHVVRIRGTVCAAKEEWAEESRVNTSGGRQAEVSVSLPDVESNWSWWRSRYVYLDLELEVPDGLALNVRDSSGDMEIENVASVRIKDSSGDIEVRDVTGSLVVEDSSGDIDVRDMTGDLTVEADSSGDIYGKDIQGTVLVMQDSSGDIRFRNIGQDFIVERESSGDISAIGVGGGFRVLKDGSGEIRSEDVAGEVVVPDKG